MIEVSAPVRICDLGGWTDTWFGAPGRVLNLAVAPGVQVSIDETSGPDRVRIDVDDGNDPYVIVPRTVRTTRHPLVEAAIDAWPPPDDVAVAIRVCSAVPPGCGTGTSAAVAVALLGGLAALRSEPWSAAELATRAHRLEVDVLGLESGVQDQLSSAHGGINYLEIDEYPDAVVHPLGGWDELSDRVSLIFLGRAHDSSGVHRDVIEHIADTAPRAFDQLRDAATAGRDAVRARDLHAFGAAMVDNTAAQALLHPDLVGADAQRVIDAAERHGAIGWKVNGAGGDGGSLTLLSATRADKESLAKHVAQLDAHYEFLPVAISPTGVEVRRGSSRAGARLLP